ncbi:MAG: hypothetical protein ACREJD_06820 [Phycisphaerales bacterium]
MTTRTQQNSHRLAGTLLLGAATIVAFIALSGCSGAGQGEVTQGDRPSEGEGWAVQEQMADRQGQ